jgi:DNA processing protein
MLSQPLIDELALWFITQHSVSAYQALTAHFKTATQAISASTEQWSQLRLHHSHAKNLTNWRNDPRLKTQFETALQQINPTIDRILRLTDDDYPSQLKQIADPPPFLFVRGHVHALQQPQIAMVGSRKPTQTGCQVAHHFAKILSDNGFWITSGLAYGIDAEAHKGTLQQGSARTIAVLGTGVNICYPSAHQTLYRQILDQGGTIVSEFLPNTPAKEYHFPRRNRIVSGLSLGTLVVEAALKSGSLITAQCALEHNRQVFAIPGHVFSEQSKGCHQLIRDGALLVDDPQQIIEELALPRSWQSQQATHNSLPIADRTITPVNAPEIPVHLQPLYQKMDWVGQNMDDLIERSKLDIAILSSYLMEMELLGLAVQQGGLYQRCQQ